MVEEDLIKQRLTDTFHPHFLGNARTILKEVKDFSDGCGAKYNLIVVSDLFDGKKLIDRQRLVHSALEKEMPGIHALTMKTYTLQQWNTLQ